MSNSYEVVTDIAEIARLNEELGRRLSRMFKVKRTREITYPAGHETGTVYFETATGLHVRAWSPSERRDKFINFLLVGDPSSSSWMQIDVQMNFPANSYNRRMAGAFVIDEHGHTLVAHRGKLTKGKAGLHKTKVFREFASRVVEADDKGLTSKVILISALDDPELANRLWGFALEAREVATRIGAEENDDTRGDSAPAIGGSGGGSGKKPAAPPKDPMLKLRSYFDEYAGEGTSKGHGGGKRTVEHGDIVKALETQLRGNGRSQKAQAIDLAIVAAEVDLYEVKTSASTTDVYTGVGQLLIHGECIHELLERTVRRHLVLPMAPRASHKKHITKKGGINIVTYEKDGGGYHFQGLA
ncbi:hypothetical protein ACWKW4_20920 [Hydrogenophaga borbori]